MRAHTKILSVLRMDTPRGGRSERPEARVDNGGDIDIE